VGCGMEVAILGVSGFSGRVDFGVETEEAGFED
jgi:hypothetical protein